MALVDDGCEVAEGELIMKLSAGRADHTVPRPGIHEIRLGGEVGAGIDVMITSGNDMGVAMITAEQTVDPAHSGSSARHAQRATLAEISLRVGDDQCPCHDHSSW